MGVLVLVVSCVVDCHGPGKEVREVQGDVELVLFLVVQQDVIRCLSLVGNSLREEALEVCWSHRKVGITISQF